MSLRAGAPPLVIACSVFRPELEALRASRWPGLEVRYEDSMLHMRPEKLERRLAGRLAEARSGSAPRPVGLVYGDCCAGMAAFEASPGVARTTGLNCPALLLGREEYQRLSREGAFFLLPEWTERWEVIFRVELGLDEATGPGLMQELHRKLVFLDTGVAPVPAAAIEACARFTGLPWEILRVSLDRLAASVDAALARCGGGRTA